MYKAIQKIAALILSFSCLASFSFSQNYKSEFGFNSENDTYTLTKIDQYYTNGLFIQYRTALDAGKFKKKNIIKKLLEIEIAQQIFNPQSGGIPDPSFIDRPFAGYAFLGGNLSLFNQNESMLKLSLRLGTIGPNSGAEKFQTFYHKLFGFYEIMGWENQIGNEIAINSSIQYQKLLAETDNDRTADLSIEVLGNLGTTFTGAGLSFLFRAGRIEKLFNSTINSARVINNGENLVHLSEFYFYARPSIYFVGYDATIQGRMFADDAFTFDPNRVVFNQQIGVSLAKTRWTSDVSFNFKTKRNKEMVRPHKFGSIKIYYRFGG